MFCLHAVLNDWFSLVEKDVMPATLKHREKDPTEDNDDDTECSLEHVDNTECPTQNTTVGKGWCFLWKMAAQWFCLAGIDVQQVLLKPADNQNTDPLKDDDTVEDVKYYFRSYFFYKIFYLILT